MCGCVVVCVRVRVFRPHVPSTLRIGMSVEEKVCARVRVCLRVVCACVCVCLCVPLGACVCLCARLCIWQCAYGGLIGRSLKFLGASWAPLGGSFGCFVEASGGSLGHF